MPKDTFAPSSTFLCRHCAKKFEKKKGRVIVTTDPNQPCGICKEPNSRLEYRP
jgi:hypothetical protein